MFMGVTTGSHWSYWHTRRSFLFGEYIALGYSVVSGVHYVLSDAQHAGGGEVKLRGRTGHVFVILYCAGVSLY